MLAYGKVRGPYAIVLGKMRRQPQGGAIGFDRAALQIWDGCRRL